MASDLKVTISLKCACGKCSPDVQVMELNLSDCRQMDRVPRLLKEVFSITLRPPGEKNASM